MNSLQDRRCGDASSLAVASFATLAKHKGTVFVLWAANWAIKWPSTKWASTGLYLHSTYNWLHLWTLIRSPTPCIPWFYGLMLDAHPQTLVGGEITKSETSVISLIVVVFCFLSPHFLVNLSTLNTVVRVGVSTCPTTRPRRGPRESPLSRRCLCAELRLHSTFSAAALTPVQHAKPLETSRLFPAASSTEAGMVPR